MTPVRLIGWSIAAAMASIGAIAVCLALLFSFGVVEAVMRQVK